MNRSIIRRAVTALAAMLLVVGAGTLAVAVPAYADIGTRSSEVDAGITQNGSATGITVGGQLTVGVIISDHSGDCINFNNCDNPLGTVDFVLQNADLSYNQTIATLSLSGVVNDSSQGYATIDNPLPAGTYHVDAHYNGDPNFAPNNGTLDNVVVSALTPDVSITQSSTSSYQGDPVTFSASVGSPNGVHPTGTVQLVYGMTGIGGPLTLDGSGNASITRTDLPLSDSSGHTYYFHYSGDAYLNAADSTSLDHQTLAKIPTTTTVSVSTPTRQDDPVLLSAGVSAAGGVQPPGTVTFFAMIGTIEQASTTATLSGGVATGSFPAYGLPPLPFTVIAQYSPSDPSYAASSASTPLVVTPAIPLTGVVLDVSATPSPGRLGSPETLHVVATAPSGSTTPAEGAVGFQIGSSPLGSCILAPAAGGTTACDLTTSTLPAGVDPIVVTYAGSTHYAAVEASLSVTITEPSATTLTASPTTATSGTKVTLTAQVSFADPVTGEPTGTVTFRDGSGLIGSASVDASGKATLTTTVLPLGKRTITANYSGDAVVDSSASAPVTVTITAPVTSHPTGSSTSSTTSPSGSSSTTTANGSGTLADTGVRHLWGLNTAAVVLLLLGVACTVLGRRRRPAGRTR
ncbi:MAG: Ig-like domain-containing protein [Jatrophihabitantaceae bacterium]